jgi:2-keto-3-deoxy-6-phosphogluconate aldolase
MNKETIRARIEEIGILPAIRLSSAEDALFAVKAVADSGIPIAEITMTVPGAIEVISELARDRPELRRYSRGYRNGAPLPGRWCYVSEQPGARS